VDARKSFDILVVGHFARDEIVVDGVSTHALGGAVFYGGIALSRLGMRVAAVTRLHPRDFPRLDDFKKAGVWVKAVEAAETSGIENTYQSANMERRVCKPLGFAGAFTKENMPDVDAQLILIAPIIAGEVDLDLLRHLATRAPVALDVQGFVRVSEGDSLVFKEWPDIREGLSHVTYLKVDQAEAELLTGETDPSKALPLLADMGASEIVMTQSSGVTVWGPDGIVSAPFTSRTLVGRTGRGDTCFSSYVAMRLTESSTRATQIAGAVTSLKQEKPGPWSGTWEDIEEAMRRKC